METEELTERQQRGGGRLNLVFTFLIAVSLVPNLVKNLKKEIDQMTPEQRACVVERVSSKTPTLGCFPK